jgi:hypothetical protein
MLVDDVSLVKDDPAFHPGIQAIIVGFNSGGSSGSER